ncbi:MAG: hypothetical protein K8R91_01300 [Phycisphaerae bacterium]|nr:hypothetical protein [Phycisphaerae bacterium]
MSNLPVVSVRPEKLDIYRTAIPMRSFEHAAAARESAEAIVVRLELPDGSVGWGETLPRKYVTGETLESVPDDIERLFGDLTKSRQMSEANLSESGRNNAAACALDLAWTDAGARSEGKSLGGPIPPGVRVSAVLGSSDPSRTAKRLRLMRLFGLRDFKLKLGFGDETDTENLRIVQKRIGKAILNGKCTLRVDVNGGWGCDETPEHIAALKPFGVCVVEQPVYCPAAELVELAQRCDLPLMVDESLITAADANEFVRAPGKKVWWNIRISKNGGLAQATSFCALAEEHAVPYTVGCMVGESGILSAAQRRLLSTPVSPRFVEGNYGKFLLSDDLTKPSLRFGYGGRLKPLKGPGLGVEVDPRKIASYGTLIKTLRAQEG